MPMSRPADRPTAYTMLPPFAAYAGTYQNPVMGTMVVELNAAGTLELRAGAAWSAVEVYDGTKNQLRVQPFGSGTVVQMAVVEGRVVGATMDRVPFRKTR